MKLAEALTRLQTLKRKRDVYKSLVDAADNGKRDRLFSRDVRTKDEVKQIIYPDFDVNRLRRMRDDLAKQVKQLDLRIQRTNWRAEIENQTLAEALLEIKRLNEENDEKVNEVKRYTRIYEDDLEHAPKIELLLAEAIETLDQIERKKLALQRKNWEVDLV